MEYYSSLKRKEILTHATTWMNLEDIMLSEQVRDNKTNITWFHLYEATRIVKFIEKESKMVVARELGEEGMGSYCLMGTEIQFGKIQVF